MWAFRRRTKKKTTTSEGHSLVKVFKSSPRSKALTQQPQKMMEPSREEGLLPTISVKTAEGIRQALELLEKPEFLEAEGLWRVCGDMAEIQDLADALCKGDATAMVDQLLKDKDPHTVAGGIKAALRRFQPLTTYSRHAAFLRLLDEEDRKIPTKALLKDLPAINRQLLGRWAQHFDQVVNHGEKNKMTWTAIGIAIGPTLLRSSEKFDLDAVQKAKHQAHAVATTAANLLSDLKPRRQKKEPVDDRCVRVRRVESAANLDAQQAEADLRKDLQAFGTVTKVGFKSGSFNDAVILFDSSRAAANALRKSRTTNWRITSLGSKKENVSIDSTSPDSSHHPSSSSSSSSNNNNITKAPTALDFPGERRPSRRSQRIVRAFTPTSQQHDASVGKHNNHKTRPYSLNDLALAMEEQTCINELLGLEDNNSNNNTGGYALATANW